MYVPCIACFLGSACSREWTLSFSFGGNSGVHNEGKLKGKNAINFFCASFTIFWLRHANWWRKKPETLLDICTLDILFSQITTFIKDCVAIVFGLQTLRLIDFTKIYRLKNLKPKNNGQMLGFDEKSISKVHKTHWKASRTNYIMQYPVWYTMPNTYTATYSLDMISSSIFAFSIN